MSSTKCFHRPLIAVALMGGVAAAPVHAQGSSGTNVQIYGVIDAGVTVTDPKANGVSSTSAVTSGNQSGSRWGLRATEDLGNGLRASFMLESGFNVDTGQSAQGGRLFGRQAWAALGGSYGELRIGRQESIGFELAGLMNPFGTSWNDAGLQTTFASADSLRLDNTVMYRSPTLAGAMVMVGYSFNPSGAEAAGSGNNPAVITAGGRYTSGPVSLALSYESVNCPDTATTTPVATCSTAQRDDQRHIQLGGSYDFGVVRVFAAWAQERDRFEALGATSAAALYGDATAYAVGVSVPLVGGSVLADFQQRKDDTDGRADDAKLDLKAWAIGYSYPLSRRTNLWTYVSERKGDKALTDSTAFDRRQFGAGVRHTF